MHGSQVRSGDEIDKIGTIFMQMANRIVHQIKELRSADTQRREFTATITHDLRTPLTSLQGYLETLVLKEGTLTAEERQEYLGIAIKRSNQLAKLVSALFELAKLDSPDVQVRFAPFSLGELIQDILQKFQLAAGQKKIVLQMNIEEQLPLVFGDIGLIERVIENLIDNALRYTPEGGSVLVSARPVQSSKYDVQTLKGMDSILRTPYSELDADLVEISVSDTGSGISSEDIPAIFDRYQRGRSHPDIRSGSGFGLTIARRVLELHKSDLTVKSTPTAGTIFTFTLPSYRP